MVSEPASGRPCAGDLIMLAGLPRSGTTWVGKIFDSHPDTVYRHEPDGVEVPDIEVRAAADADDRYREQLWDTVDRMLGTRATRCTVRTPFFRKSFYSGVTWAVRVPMLHAFRIASRLLGELQVPDQLPRDRAVRYVWKSVGKGVQLLGAVAHLLPRSRSVFIVRHPGGYVASQLRGQQRGAFTAGGLIHEERWALERVADAGIARARGVTADTLAAASPAERLAWIWVWQNDMVLDGIDGTDNVTVLRYEDLCADPVRVARELFAFTGLGWSPQTEEFLASSTSTDRDSFYSLTKDPEKSANKWRQELAEDDRERVLAVVRGTRSGALYEL